MARDKNKQIIQQLFRTKTLMGSSSKTRPEAIGRALARAGILTLAQAEIAVRERRISIGAANSGTRGGAKRVVRDLVTFLRPEEILYLDGRAISLESETLAIAFHKPKGAVVAPSDNQGGQTVFDLLAKLLPPELESYCWHAIGRLDRDTTGLLLFTNDERLVSHVTSPTTHLAKRYVATVFGNPSEERLEPLRRGIALSDGPARPATAKLRSSNEVELTISEGRNHQVKRMLGAVGLPVASLHREAIGDLVLDLPLGLWRLLSKDEIEHALKFSQGVIQ